MYSVSQYFQDKRFRKYGYGYEVAIPKERMRELGVEQWTYLADNMDSIFIDFIPKVKKWLWDKGPHSYLTHSPHTSKTIRVKYIDGDPHYIIEFAREESAMLFKLTFL